MYTRLTHTHAHTHSIEELINGQCAIIIAGTDSGWLHEEGNAAHFLLLLVIVKNFPF